MAPRDSATKERRARRERGAEGTSDAAPPRPDLNLLRSKHTKASSGRVRGGARGGDGSGGRGTRVEGGPAAPPSHVAGRERAEW